MVELNRGGDSFTVVGFDDIHYVAALGSFVMLPVATDYVVAEVVGLWEKDPTSGRAGIEGAGLDKAASAKFLELVPVGMLPQSPAEGFRFGVSAYPALYVDALYALESELDRIFEVADHVEQVGPDAIPNRLPRAGNRHFRRLQGLPGQGESGRTVRRTRSGSGEHGQRQVLHRRDDPPGAV